MSDEQIRSTLATQIPPGASPDQVKQGLGKLGVGDKYRIDYPPKDGRPQVLLTRLFDAGGFWMHGEDCDVEWVDVSFVFTPPPERLDRTLLFRDKLRYFNGDPITSPNSPRRPLMARPQHYPAPIPPPVDPLEGAE
jgi:hypothetical protein